jgi:hypothetical protein
MIRLRIEGTQAEINKFSLGNMLTDSAKEKIQSVSKFYPNDRESTFGIPKTGRVYIEIDS